MVNERFALYQVKREIRRSGRDFDIYRDGVNEYGEPTNEPEKIYTITGLYHEHSAHMLDTYVIVTGMDTTSYRTKKTPQILFRWEDLFFKNKLGQEDSIKLGDMVNFNGHLAKVTGVTNVMEWNLVGDISFEEVDYGSQSDLPGGQKPN